MTLENTTEPANLELTTENVINVAQNEPHYICDSIVNATEEKKTFNMPQNLWILASKMVSYLKWTGVILLLQIIAN